MQLQHARSAAKYRNICSGEERELHERGVVKRDTALYRRWECTEGVGETSTPLERNATQERKPVP